LEDLPPPASGTPALKWTGRIVTAIVIAFLLMDGAIKFLDIPQVAASFTQLGYPATAGPVVGVIGLLCAALYAAPRTALLGTVLVTGLCGGAVASHFRIGSPLLTHTLFGVYVGVLAWGGLWCRDARLRALMPWRRQERTMT